MGRHEVQFAFYPDKDPDTAIGHARTVVNPDHGMGMDVLTDIIKKHIPVASNPETHTYKSILYVDRYECPCCNTSIYALIDVSCSGQMGGDVSQVQGLYRIRINPDHGGCKVVVEKLAGQAIYEGRTPYLPHKDYASDPDARKEIEDRNASLERFARENPGRVFFATGVETSEDLGNLIETMTKKLEKE